MDATDYSYVAVVDVLGAKKAHEDIADIKALLQTSNTLLTEIRDGLKHVEVDSFVNVRVMDDLGEIPIPSTVATGLLVSAFATGDAIAVTVDNPYLNVVINNDTGTAPLVASVINGLRVDHPNVIRANLMNTGSPYLPVQVDVVNQPIAVTGYVDASVTGTVDIGNPIVVTSITDDVNVRDHCLGIDGTGWYPTLGNPAAAFFTNTTAGDNVDMGSTPGAAQLALSTGQYISTSYSGLGLTNVTVAGSPAQTGLEVKTL